MTLFTLFFKRNSAITCAIEPLPAKIGYFSNLSKIKRIERTFAIRKCYPQIRIN